MLEITDTLTNELLRDMESVLGLVAEAGRIALERAETATPEEKSNATYVTDLDKDLEKLLRAELAVRFPQDTLTGEEYPDTGTGGPRLWSSSCFFKPWADNCNSRVASRIISSRRHPTSLA